MKKSNKMEKNKKEGNKEDLFKQLPKVLKEEIFCWLQDLEDVGRLRRVCKTFRDIIDKGSRTEFKGLQELSEYVGFRQEMVLHLLFWNKINSKFDSFFFSFKIIKKI